jgi:hypothetical protein
MEYNRVVKKLKDRPLLYLLQGLAQFINFKKINDNPLVTKEDFDLLKPSKKS